MLSIRNGTDIIMITRNLTFWHLSERVSLALSVSVWLPAKVAGKTSDAVSQLRPRSQRGVGRGCTPRWRDVDGRTSLLVSEDGEVERAADAKADLGSGAIGVAIVFVVRMPSGRQDA